MSIEKKVILETAQLARLQFDETELETLNSQLNQIFELFVSINTPEISALKPLTHPLELTQPLRADVAIKQNMLPSLEINAPDFENDFIKVPKVIE